MSKVKKVLYLCPEFNYYSSSNTNNMKTNLSKTGRILATALIVCLTLASFSFRVSATPDNNSSNYSTTIDQNDDKLVGRYSAFGIGSAFGNTVTHSQTFEVFQDNKGYYIKDPKYRNVKNYLQRNTKSEYMGYSVKQYNYWTLTTLGSDIFWYFKI